MKKNAIKVSFKDAQAANHVTGSCLHIYNKNIDIVVECGLSQSNNLERDYKENKEKFSFSCQKIKYVLVGHSHLDHIGRLPLLYKRGCQAPIYVAAGNAAIIKSMLNDCAKIMEKDAETLSIRKNRNIEPIYSREDIEKTIDAIVELPFDKEIKIDDYVSIRFIHSGHIAHAAQIEIWLTDNNVTKKILYTSDLGNSEIQKNYSQPVEYCEKANMVIGETTYGDKNKPVATKKMREKDLEKMKQMIDEVCGDHKGKILIPSFALDRLPELLTIVFQLVGNSVPIIVDTPLGVEHLMTYIKQNYNGPLLQSIIDQPNVSLITDYNISKMYYNLKGPAIILSSSGMMTAGRVLNYLPNILSREENGILFCGYSTEGTLASEIKKGKKRFIFMGDIKIPNRAKIMVLNSFSSHMQYPELLKYYTSIQYDRLVLVHGQEDIKRNFAEDIREQLSKQARSSRVICSVKGMELTL